MIRIDLQSRVPIYEQLKSQIIQLSVLGVWDENQKLPSVRSLAREIGVNPNTVQKAYQELEREGILCTVPGKGSFVSAGTIAREQVRRKGLDEVRQSAAKAVQCGCTVQEVLQAAQEAAEQSQGHVAAEPSQQTGGEKQ